MARNERTFTSPLYPAHFKHADPLDNVRYALEFHGFGYNAEPELSRTWRRSGLDTRFNLTPRQLLDPDSYHAVDLPLNLQRAFLQYWSSLAQVDRWQNGDPIVHPDGFRETNFRHTLACVRMAKNLGVQFPSFGAVMCNAAEKLVFHDGAEKFMGGDVNRTDMRARAGMDDTTKPKMEYDTLARHVIPLFPIETRAYIASIMHQYFMRDEAWFEGRPILSAEMAKLIDIAQGGKTALNMLYPSPELVGAHVNSDIRRNRIRDTANRLFRQMERVSDIVFRPHHQQPQEVIQEWEGIVSSLLQPFKTQNDNDIDAIFRLPGADNMRGLLRNIFERRT